MLLPALFFSGANAFWFLIGPLIDRIGRREGISVAPFLRKR